MTYSIGEARNPRDNDSRFPSFEEAQSAAVKRSEREDCIFAVWEDERGEILVLVYEGLVYRP
jgi:hypothetical protein